MTKPVSQTLQMTHRFIMGGQPTYSLSALHIFSRVRPICHSWRAAVTKCGRGLTRVPVLQVWRKVCRGSSWPSWTTRPT